MSLNISYDVKNENSHQQSTFSNQLDLAIAIDYCGSMFMFLGLDYHVNYLNFKALQFIIQNESNLKLYDDNFNAHIVIGNTISYFSALIHEYPQIHDLQLGQTHTIIETMGTTHLKIKVSPIFDQSLIKTGYCLELADISDLIQARYLFKQAMSSALEGDFSHPIDTKALSIENCLFKEIYDDVNHVFGQLDHFFQDIAVGLEHLSSGNLNYCLTVNHDQKQSNIFEALKNDINYTADKLRFLVQNIHTISLTMNTMISQLMQTNSEVAMSVEKEFVDAGENKNEIDEQIHTLKQNSVRIEQATSIIDLDNDSHHKVDLIKDLKTTVNSMGKQILDISVIAKSMEYFFMIHLDGLRTGLDEIKKGSLGRGINMIQVEVGEIIAKAGDAMRQIRTSLDDLGANFSQSNDSVDRLLNHLTRDMIDMEETIACLSETLKLIQSLIHQQDETFNRFSHLTTKLDDLRFKTMSEIESMVIATSDLINFSNVLGDSINTFRFNELKDDIINELCALTNHLSDDDNNDSVVFLWD